MDFWNNAIDEAGGIAGAAFQWMSARDQAKYASREAQAWAEAYGQAAPAMAAAQAQAAVAQSAGRDKLLIAGFAILAVVVLFRVRPTANG